ncbi:MAG: hypothetical protein Ct9H300mP1_02930 [Planctomycetaceae bacterium]|nr:MAG: hypothetical protein Ct9H300mP1_02930 [Planctomycetaceae bacterium]
MKGPSLSSFGDVPGVAGDVVHHHHHLQRALVPPSLNDVPCDTGVGRAAALKVHWSGQPPVGRWMVSRMSQQRRADSRYVFSPDTLWARA